jgi:hypothetical protein
MTIFQVGDEVQRREWVNWTRGRVVAVSGDDTVVTVKWHAGLRLTGTVTTEHEKDLKRVPGSDDSPA